MFTIIGANFESILTINIYMKIEVIIKLTNIKKKININKLFRKLGVVIRVLFVPFR